MNLKIKKIQKNDSRVNSAIEKSRIDKGRQSQDDNSTPIGMNDILIYLYEKYEGDWDEMFEAINSKERVDYGETRKFLKGYKSKYDYVTLIDEDYPEEYKGNYKPPFVLRKRKNKQR